MWGSRSRAAEGDAVADFDSATPQQGPGPPEHPPGQAPGRPLGGHQKPNGPPPQSPTRPAKIVRRHLAIKGVPSIPNAMPFR